MDAGSVSLIVAALDLQLVRLLRAAMAGRPGGRPGGPGGICGEPALPIRPRPVLHPTPTIEPRKRIEPTPRIEPRQVIHPKPIEQPGLALSCTPAEPEHPRVVHLPIQPPWKVLPWQNPPPPRPMLKVVLRPPDVEKKGSLYDVFA